MISNRIISIVLFIMMMAFLFGFVSFGNEADIAITSFIAGYALNSILKDLSIVR